MVWRNLVNPARRSASAHYTVEILIALE